MTYRTINVKPEVYERAQSIARANFRKLGEQVAYWVAQSCQHPVKAREALELQITYPGQSDIVPAHGFKCRACGRLVVLDGRQEEDE